MDDFLKFRALAYDHPWHSFTYVFGMLFLVVSIADWGVNMLFGWESHSFLYRMAFGATMALVVHFRERSREARSRLA